MLPLLLGASAFGLAITLQGDQSDTQQSGGDYGPTNEDIDDLLIGRLREENIRTGNNFLTENARIIRPKNGRQNPVASAREWTNYHRKHNQVLQDLYAKDKIATNMKILRADTVQMKRMPFLPHAGGVFAGWNNVPNAYFDYDGPPSGKYRLDVDYSFYDDQVGQSGGMPIEGWKYVWNPAEWHGNPWGPAGQLFHNLRSDNTLPSAYGPPPAKLQNDKRVRFGGTTVF
jgi:hypothetical protein